MNKAGAPQTEGVHIENAALLRDKCLKICKKYGGATACEYNTDKNECRIHTLFVKVTTGKLNIDQTVISCFLFGMYCLAQPQPQFILKSI